MITIKGKLYVELNVNRDDDPPLESIQCMLPKGFDVIKHKGKFYYRPKYLIGSMD